MSDTEEKADLDRFYATPDPWGYENHPDDARRKMELLSLLPRAQTFARALDIGCGDGFVTFDLPAKKVIGIDLSSAAIDWAGRRLQGRKDSDRFSFASLSLLDADPAQLGRFDLVVITGVLYRQYIGKSAALVRQKIDGLLLEGGVLASCHILEWQPPRFPYTTLDVAIYPYREYMHRLEVYRK